VKSVLNERESLDDIMEDGQKKNEGPIDYDKLYTDLFTQLTTAMSECIGPRENWLCFKKIEDETIEAEKAKLQENLKENSEDENMSDLISIDQFDEVVIKIGQIKEAEKIEKSDKLLKLQVDIGEEKTRQIVAGLAKFYSPEDLIGRKVCVIANLQPAKLFGTLSEGMILATGESGALLTPDVKAEIGERIQ
jgi:methionyl-tRNA synthetase